HPWRIVPQEGQLVQEEAQGRRIEVFRLRLFGRGPRLVEAIHLKTGVDEVACTTRLVQAEGLASFREGFVILPERAVDVGQVARRHPISWVSLPREFIVETI